MFKSGMAGMMQKAQQMQDNMQKAQDEIKILSATGQAASGAVQITINGEHMATNIKIDEIVMDDKDMLEDLILTAMNDATQQISSASEAKMKGVTGGMNLPSDLKFPF